MNFKDFFDENEKPLDKLLEGSGFVPIFRSIGFIGDSLSSGEYEATAKDGGKTYHDFYEESWGQHIGRIAGLKAINFSRGGMSAKEMMQGFCRSCHLFEDGYKTEAYVIALGVNDINMHLANMCPFGDFEDIDFDNPENCKDSFVGWYGKMILELIKFSPESKFFLMTVPKVNFKNEIKNSLYKKHREVLAKICEKFDNFYLLDFYSYAPEYDELFYKKFAFGHLSPAGYVLTARMVISYIDYIIRRNMEDFKLIGFFGSPYTNDSPLVKAENIPFEPPF